jgi:hypothetical protein
VADQIDLVLKDMDGFTERTIIELSLNVTANLQEDTPRDTGWARANWIPSVGAPALTPALTDEAPSPANVAEARARAEAGTAAVVGYRLNKGSVFTTNGVPYLEQLNAGSSKQAPAGFVQRSVERGIKQTTGRRSI